MDSRRRSRQLIWWPLASTLGACLVGAVAAAVLVVVLTARDTGSNPWASLGYLIFGLVVGFVVVGVTWLLGLVVVARKFFPRGERAGVVAVAALAAVVPGVVIGFVGRAVSGDVGWLLWLSSWPLALGTAPFVFRWWDRRVGPAAGGPVWQDAPWGLGGPSVDLPTRAAARFSGESSWRPDGSP